VHESGSQHPRKGRRRLRRALTAVSALLVVAGVGVIAYPFLTDVYTAQVRQPDLEQDFQALERELDDSDRQPAYAAQAKDLAPDDPLTRMVIPKLDVNTLVVAGTTAEALRAGAGHYPDTPLPGQEGNVGIAGHRTTYGKPLSHAEQLTVGDEVRLETPVATYTYEVIPPPQDAPSACDQAACWITRPDDWSVVEDLDGHYLTLTTCHPRGSDSQRLIVRARLAETDKVADR
jgi:sortase A